MADQQRPAMPLRNEATNSLQPTTAARDETTRPTRSITTSCDPGMNALDEFDDSGFPTARAGFADIVGFGQDGVVMLRNGFSIQAFTAIKDYGYNAGGWRIEKHVRLVADTTGDGTGDIVGFGEAGVLISFNNGDNTFTSPVKLVLKDFAYGAGGWRVEKHLRYLSGIRSIGRCDIVGFGDPGSLVSRNDGNGKFNPAIIAIKDFGYNAGGFGENHVFVSRNNGNGTFAPVQAVIDNFCYSAGGWRVDQRPRFIADFTGDGKVDVVGCDGAGVYASLNKGDGTFGPVNLVINNFGTAQGWKVAQHPHFIADLTGDKRGDVIGFGDSGVYVSYNNGNGTFQPAKFVPNSFGIQQGWQVAKHPRFVVDLTGDGRADIIGFGDSQTYVSYNDGKGGFGPVIPLTSEFSFSGGKWGVERNVRWLANLNQTRFKRKFDILDEDLRSSEFGRMLKVRRKAKDGNDFGLFKQAE